MELSNEVVFSIEKALSIPRLSKYEKYYKNLNKAYSKQDVIKLYEYNLIVSNKFFYLLNYFEIVLRNAVVEAIEISFNSSSTYSWHLNEGFIQSLSSKGRYPHRAMFTDAARKFPRYASKIVPELKFVFWQKMFLSRFEERIWQSCFSQVFPNALTEDRQTFYNWIEQLRSLRNRIAHHEPIIFNRILEEDLIVLMIFIYCRCEHTYSFLEPFASELQNMLQNNSKT